MVSRFRIRALLAGLAVDFSGSIVVGLAVVLFLHGHPQSTEMIIRTLTTYVSPLLAVYWLGLAFTFFGAYVTARLSKPNCILNTAVFGIISTLPCFFFPSSYPFWYQLLCVLTILPVSLVAGYSVATRSV